MTKLLMGFLITDERRSRKDLFWLLIFYRLLFATGAGMVYNKISGYFNYVNTHLGG